MKSQMNEITLWWHTLSNFVINFELPTHFLLFRVKTRKKGVKKVGVIEIMSPPLANNLLHVSFWLKYIHTWSRRERSVNKRTRKKSNSHTATVKSLIFFNILLFFLHSSTLLNFMLGKHLHYKINWKCEVYTYWFLLVSSKNQFNCIKIHQPWPFWIFKNL